MKVNIVKYLFILFMISIICFAVYKIYYKENVVDDNQQSDIIEVSQQTLTNLRIGIASFDNINPLISQNRDVINLSTIIYEPLMNISENYKLQLALAKECSKISENTYIVKIKEKAKWEDGTNITVKDVKFTIDKLKEDNESIYADNVNNIDSVEIIDSLTLRINLLKEEPFFEYNLIFPIISCKQFEKEENFFKSRIAPMASGMYRVKKAEADSMQLVMNDNWYNSQDVSRKIENIKINFYSSMGDAYNSFKIGNIDMICTSNVKITDYIGTIGFTNKEYRGRELDFISLNCKEGILANKEVRQAIKYAIDKKKIISSVYGDEYYVSAFPLDYGSYLYPKDSKSSYNKNKARQVLEDNGWEYQYGRWQKTEDYYTKTISLNLVVDNTNEDRVNVAKLIEEELESIGINVSLYQVSNANYKYNLENRSYDMIITGVNNGYSPDLSYFLGENNIANYKNEEITTILSDLKNISDENVIKEKYNRIIEIYEDEVPYVCLYRNKLKVIYNMKLIGDFNPNNYTSYYNIENWYRQ